MVTISLCMIVKDEEDNLIPCLNSVKGLVDEIIIVDTGSRDHTKEIAHRYTDKVFDFEWMDDFSAARNYSFSKASKDYILWLDADDVMLGKDRDNFMKLKSILTLKYDVVVMKYILRRDAQGKETYSISRERMVKSSNHFKWVDPIHEYLDFSGRILQTDIAITHTKTADNPVRNLKILKKLVGENKNPAPRQIFHYARESQAVGESEEAVKYYLKLLEAPGDERTPHIEGCVQLAQIYMDKGEKKKALKTLIRSFEFGSLRAEVLCMIGKIHLDAKDYQTAVPWYELALSIPKPPQAWQFFIQEYWDFIPCIELCHCYYHLGDFEKAMEYHRRSIRLKPYHPAVVQNQRFFYLLLDRMTSREDDFFE